MASYRFNQIDQSGFTSCKTIGTPEYIVAIRKQARDIGGRVHGYIENVPDVLGCGERSPLERQAKTATVLRDGDV